MENVELEESKNGMVTLGLPSNLVAVSKTAHEQFLAAHSLDYWKLIVIQIPGMRYILVFSGAPNNDEEPDYALSDADGLARQIGEILTLHHEQHMRHVSATSAH